MRSDTVGEFLGGRTGLVNISEEEAMSMLNGGLFMERSLAESDENYRQVIPYVVVISKNKVLLLKRTSKQAERRLHGFYTIGIGGHIREEDGNDPISAFRNGMFREIDEEVEFHPERFEFLGLINLLDSPVSRVHIGYLYAAFGEFLGVREREMFEWSMVSPSDLEIYRERMEGWSKIALIGLRSLLSLK